jgi:nitrogen fixation NifU-like protein
VQDLRELYQEVILDHNRHPRNFGPMPGSSASAAGKNPLCGDEITVRVKVEDGRIASARFEGQGCAISKASASMMTQAVEGMSLEEVRELFADFQNLVTGRPDDGSSEERLGKLAVFAGVREFPARVKCAVLAWHTLRAALDRSGETVSTEGAADD